MRSIVRYSYERVRSLFLPSFLLLAVAVAVTAFLFLFSSLAQSCFTLHLRWRQSCDYRRPVRSLARPLGTVRRSLRLRLRLRSAICTYTFFRFA